MLMSTLFHMGLRFKERMHFPHQPDFLLVFFTIILLALRRHMEIKMVDSIDHNQDFS